MENSKDDNAGCFRGAFSGGMRFEVSALQDLVVFQMGGFRGMYLTVGKSLWKELQKSV